MNAPTPKQVNAALRFYASSAPDKPQDAPAAKAPSLFDMFASAAASAAKSKAEAERPPWPANPFPPGIREGKCTDRVLQELRRAHPQALEAGQLRFRCGVTRGMLSWAVAYLQSQNLIEALPSPRRIQYKRYRVTKEGLNNV